MQDTFGRWAIVSDLDLVLLGNRVCEARKQCGLTQQEPANQTGLSVKMIQGIEKGHKNQLTKH
jgi:DNA-binding XRE family transcriptional regulator